MQQKGRGVIMNNYIIQNAAKDLKKAELLRELFEEAANARQANGRIAIAEFGIYYEMQEQLIWRVEHAQKELDSKLEQEQGGGNA